MNNQTEQPTDPDDLLKKLSVFERAYEREKARRQYAEKMLEDQSRDLYVSQQELTTSNNALSNANHLIENQTDFISGLSREYDRVKQDLFYAAKIQTSLLPPTFRLPKLSMLGKLKPAEFIAGDGYDYFQLQDNIVAFYMIDVVGHGIASAMTSFAVQIQLNPKKNGICKKQMLESSNLEDAVFKTLSELNRNFYHDDSTMRNFTMIYGLLDADTGELALGQAGHPSPMQWCSDNGDIIAHGRGGTPVAMLDSPLFGVHTCRMSPGDRLFLYSDGVTECRNAKDEEFDAENLMSVIRQCANLSLSEAAEQLVNSAIEWNGGEDFEDDLSILLLEYRGC